MINTQEEKNTKEDFKNKELKKLREEQCELAIILEDEELKAINELIQERQEVSAKE